MTFHAILALITSFILPVSHRSRDPEPFQNDTKFDTGLRGAYPIRDYVSSDLLSPHVNILHWDDACYDGKYVALGPFGLAVPNKGPMLMRPDGELIWLEPSYGTVEDVRVQHFQDEDYLTFWRGEPGFYERSFGRGEYLMVVWGG